MRCVRVVLSLTSRRMYRAGARLCGPDGAWPDGAWPDGAWPDGAWPDGAWANKGFQGPSHRLSYNRRYSMPLPHSYSCRWVHLCYQEPARGFSDSLCRQLPTFFTTLKANFSSFEIFHGGSPTSPDLSLRPLHGAPCPCGPHASFASMSHMTTCPLVNRRHCARTTLSQHPHRPNHSIHRWSNDTLQKRTYVACAVAFINDKP